MMIRLIAASLVLSGCAIPQSHVDSKSDIELCRSYGVFKKSPLFTAAADQHLIEMERRGLLPDDERRLVHAGKIELGMSLCGLYASWGAPDHENQSVGAWGVRTQHIFNAGYTYIKASYVYTQNGKVVSWQN